MKPSRRELTFCFLLATSPPWLFPLSGALAFSSISGISEIGFILSVLDNGGLFGFFGALGILITSPILLFFRQSRRYAALSLVLAAVFIPCEVLGLDWGSMGREEKIEHVAKRGQPIVEAIKAYETKNGHPPDSLDDLVPDFIEAIPTTGIGAWPRFYYEHSKKRPDLNEGNEWSLSAQVPGNPGFGLAPGHVIYFPRQNYSERFQLIGTWGYWRKPD